LTTKKVTYSIVGKLLHSFESPEGLISNGARKIDKKQNLKFQINPKNQILKFQT